MSELKSVKVPWSGAGSTDPRWFADATQIDANFEEVCKRLDDLEALRIWSRLAAVEKLLDGDTDTITFGKYSMAAHDAAIREEERKRAAGIVDVIVSKSGPRRYPCRRRQSWLRYTRTPTTHSPARPRGTTHGLFLSLRRSARRTGKLQF